MRGTADALQSIAVALWAGSLWTAGAVVAPLLFAVLPDRALAGLLAGRIFAAVAWLGVTCAAYVLALRLARFGTASFGQGFFRLAALMLLLSLAGQFGVQPVLAALKAEALGNGMEGVLRDKFMAWHSVAAALYLLQSVLAAGLVVLHGRGR